MKQSLQLKLGQQLTMTPQLQQAIRLLQLSTLDLQQEIQEALDSNPMLEVEDGFETAEPGAPNPDDVDYPRQLEIAAEKVNGADTADFTPSETGKESETFSDSDNYAESDSYNESEPATDWNESIPNELPVDTSWDDVYQTSSSSSSNFDGEDSDFDSRRATTESLYDHLMWQLNLTPMSDVDRIIAMAIIDAVEPSGMLSISIDEIFEGLVSELEGIELDEVVAVQHRLQQFDPCGVCSQNLYEWPPVQLQQLRATSPLLEAAKLITGQYLPLLGSRNYRQLMRRTKLKEAELGQAVTLIQSLNPRPGDMIASGDIE